MSDLLHLTGCGDIPEMLRSIADDIESGELEVDTVALVAIPNVYLLGACPDRYTVGEAVFYFNYGISKLLNAAHGVEQDA